MKLSDIAFFSINRNISYVVLRKAHVQYSGIECLPQQNKRENMRVKIKLLGMVFGHI